MLIPRITIVPSLSAVLIIRSSLFASFFKGSFSWILWLNFGSVVFLVTKFSTSLSIASTKVFTVWWFLPGSHVPFLGIIFYIYIFLVFCSLIGWYHDFLVKHKMLWVSLFFFFEFLKIINYFIFLISFWCGTKIKIFV